MVENALSLGYQCQKRPITVSKETYYSGKRDLLPVSLSASLHTLAPVPERVSRRMSSLYSPGKRFSKNNSEQTKNVLSLLGHSDEHAPYVSVTVSNQDTLTAALSLLASNVIHTHLQLLLSLLAYVLTSSVA